MEVHANKWAAIIGLHESGFIEDFVFSGTNIFWTQQKILLAPEDIKVVERYHFISPSGNRMLIFGVIANYCCAKGILMTNPKNFKMENIGVNKSESIKQIQCNLK